ncbi:hypothetical protein Tco_1074535, partial [Tanacetum coccineum]
EYENETHDERQELCEAHKLPVCNMRRFMMIKYSFGQDEEYVTIKEDEYDDLAKTSNDACRAYQEIFCMIGEGWMDLGSKEISTNIGGEFTNLEILKTFQTWFLEFPTTLDQLLDREDLPSLSTTIDVEYQQLMLS